MKTLEELRFKVLERGQQIKDTAKVNDDFLSPLFSLPLRLQVRRDMRAGYKYYDALCMWLGQEKYWTERDRNLLRTLAERYLEGEE